MREATRIEQLRDAVREWREAGQRIAFVPTMGNLHAGHHSLVELARRHAARVVVSIFVNPTQFGPDEDFARYPRTLQADAQGLREHGCDLLFVPGVQEMYPFGAEGCVSVRVPGLSDLLEGAHRPGHFDGVATVVLRLFHMVQPDCALFGRKDYQQLQVIRYLVADLAVPVEIIAAPTCRDSAGLALSSRNQYLSADERARASEIHSCLQSIAEAVRCGEDFDAIETGVADRLRAAGFEPDYVAIRRPDLSLPAATERGGLVALIAARLGNTRLIDNADL